MTFKNSAQRKAVMLKIKTTPKYGVYLMKHLQKEHPATKGKIILTYNPQFYTLTRPIRKPKI